MSLPLSYRDLEENSANDECGPAWNAAAVGFKVIDNYKGTASTRDDCLLNGTKLNPSKKNQKRPEWNTEQK